MNLTEIRNRFRDLLDTHVDPNAKPKYPRFEVESIVERKNFVISLEGSVVIIYDTSRNSENTVVTTIGPKKYSFGNTAEECYSEMYRNSLKRNSYEIYFMGYVDKNFQPIYEEAPDEESDVHSASECGADEGSADATG